MVTVFGVLSVNSTDSEDVSNVTVFSSVPAGSDLDYYDTAIPLFADAQYCQKNSRRKICAVRKNERLVRP